MIHNTQDETREVAPVRDMKCAEYFIQQAFRKYVERGRDGGMTGEAQRLESGFTVPVEVLNTIGSSILGNFSPDSKYNNEGLAQVMKDTLYIAFEAALDAMTNDSKYKN